MTLSVPGRDGQVREAESLQPDVVLAYKTDLVQPAHRSQPKMLGAARRKELTRSWST
jgi:hypothetical protein